MWVSAERVFVEWVALDDAPQIDDDIIVARAVTNVWKVDATYGDGQQVKSALRRPNDAHNNVTVRVRPLFILDSIDRFEINVIRCSEYCIGWYSLVDCAKFTVCVGAPTIDSSTANTETKSSHGCVRRVRVELNNTIERDKNEMSQRARKTVEKQK